MAAIVEEKQMKEHRQGRQTAATEDMEERDSNEA